MKEMLYVVRITWSKLTASFGCQRAALIEGL